MGEMEILYRSEAVTYVSRQEHKVSSIFILCTSTSHFSAHSFHNKNKPCVSPTRLCDSAKRLLEPLDRLIDEVCRAEYPRPVLSSNLQLGAHLSCECLACIYSRFRLV